MAARPISSTPLANRFLASLSKADTHRLEPFVTAVTLSPGEILLAPDGGNEHVYFPTSCLVSLLHSTRQGGSVEVAIVGTDGLVGIVATHEDATCPHRAVVQSGGQALRVSAAVLRREMEMSPSLRSAIWHYTHVLLTQVAQVAVCNTVHTLHQRLCRWILVSRDRLGIGEILATQESLAFLLGVRRESVSHAAASLQRNGLVHYVRGHLHIVDPSRMEAEGCECHSVIRDAYANLVAA